MVKKPDSLAALRDEIDGIDDALLDLLESRAALAARVAAVKTAESPAAAILRPGREAAILNRLLRRHGGALGRETLVRIWRELMPAMVALQGDFRVGVDEGDDPVAYWDLARSHFGSATPMDRYESAVQVLRAVVEHTEEGVLAVGIVPLAGEDGDRVWWAKLADPGAPVLRVLARLPFLKGAQGPAASAEAVVVGPCEIGPGERDVTALIVRAEIEVSRARLIEWMEGAGLPATAIAACQPDAARPERLHFLEIAEGVDTSDPRFAKFRDASSDRVYDVIVVGGYALIEPDSGG